MDDITYCYYAPAATVLCMLREPARPDSRLVGRGPDQSSDAHLAKAEVRGTVCCPRKRSVYATAARSGCWDS